jgi:hypothetical protein
MICLAAALSLATVAPSATLAAEQAPLLPESLAARAEMASNQKTLTVLIEEDDPEKAVAALNASNEEYGKKGWTVLNILTYTNNEDFDGFFVTYQKSLVIE